MVQVAATGFTFLSPLVKDAAPVGVFNPDLQPVLEVCRSGDPQASCVRVLTTGELATGIAVDGDSAHYKALWRFDGTSWASGEYRLSVLSGPAAGAAVLGYVDVTYDAASGRVLYPDGQVISQSGTTPVKFFIARGLLCSTRESDNPLGQPCLETTVGPAGGTFTVDTKLAGVYFPPGALSETVTLIIERYEPPAEAGAPATDYACLPVTHPQYEGCYVYRTDPVVEQFNLEVVVGICPVLTALPLEQELELWKWDEEPGSEVLELPRRSVDFLECPGYDGVEEGGTFGNQLSWGQRLLQPLAKLLLPTPLQAAKISPFGGGLNDFSRIGWVRPLALQVMAGDGQTGYVGELVLTDPQVRVVANGEKVAGLGIGIPGVTVEFTPADGSGTAAPTTAVTDATGYASTTWRLGREGTNTLVVNGYNPLSGFPNNAGIWSVPPHAAPAVFTATGVLLPPPPEPSRYKVVFTSPLESGKLNRTDVNVAGVPVVVRACSQATAACWYARRVVANGSYHFQWRTESTYPAGRYDFTVLEGSTVLGSFVGAVAKDGTKLERGVDFNFELNATIPVKFYLVAR